MICRYKMKCNFTHSHYAEILQMYLDAGYKFYTFNEHPQNLMSFDTKVVFLRHDIDNSLERALKLASIESSICIKSTYFIRLHATMYNPFSYPSIKIVKELLEHGHEIGIHYEPGLIDNESLVGLVDRMITELTMMEVNYDTGIRSISTHEPRMEKHKVTKDLLKLISLKHNAYSDKFTKDMKYISDSSIVPISKGRWREGCMCQHIGKYDKMQILMHPILWYKDTSLENY